MAQWKRILLPMQETLIRSLIQEDPTDLGAAKPRHHNYGACALEPENCNHGTLLPKLLKTEHTKTMKVQEEPSNFLHRGIYLTIIDNFPNKVQ